MKKLSKLKGNELVEKLNILNELLTVDMTLQEMRFFSIYLSKINARDISTRIVRFPLSDFQKIMEFGRMNITQLKTTTDSLLCKIIHVPTENGGYRSFQLFKECTVDKDDITGSWFVEIDAHDKALPLMFDYKSKYFTYEIWNVLKLKSKNQYRMYEILKQYENIGERILSIEELQRLLGVEAAKYSRYNNFRQWVIDACCTALKEYTDISFTYDAAQRGSSGKIAAIRFTIVHNTPNALVNANDYIHNADNNSYSDEIEFLAEACDKEFSEKEMIVLRDLVCQIVPYNKYENTDIQRYDYLLKKYNELQLASERNSKIGDPIVHRYNYLLTMIKSDLN